MPVPSIRPHSFLKYADGSYGNHGDRLGGKERQRQRTTTNRKRESIGTIVQGPPNKIKKLI